MAARYRHSRLEHPHGRLPDILIAQSSQPETEHPFIHYFPRPPIFSSLDILHTELILNSGYKVWGRNVHIDVIPRVLEVLP